MDFHLPPPTPEQWTQMVLGVGGGVVLYGASVGVAKLKRWLGRRALENLKALTTRAEPETDSAVVTEPAPEPARDPVAAHLLVLLSKDEEWSLKPHSMPHDFAYLVRHPSGVEFATDADRKTSGAAAVFRFKVGELHLFDQTTKLNKSDAEEIQNSAWDLASRIIRKRVLDAIAPPQPPEPVAEKEKMPAILSEKFGRLARQGRDFQEEIAQKLVDSLAEQTAQAALSKVCVERCATTPQTTEDPKAAVYPRQWVLFMHPRNGEYPTHTDDPSGDPYRKCLSASCKAVPEDAVQRLLYFAPWSLPDGREFTMYEYGAGVKPHWRTPAERCVDYKWVSCGGAPVLIAGPRRRYEVITADGKCVFPLPAQTVAFGEVRAAVSAYARANAGKTYSKLPCAYVTVVTDSDGAESGQTHPVGLFKLTEMGD